MSDNAVNPIHKSCSRCGATLHAPGFTFDGPPDTGTLTPTVEHTGGRCTQLISWYAHLRAAGNPNAPAGVA
jgi:hypothetical protein